ncbi:hypothetical protein B0H16DRAFT_1696964 [Mycena metata]|uniref:Uncharacterized protein n=1 Tax=Mycena metata TaxID=1033252 RepID=A0AAD7HYK3_9AGAR|nr:hypothetical protein B0H16DRAFT_1696964 [Mycena metata]
MALLPSRSGSLRDSGHLRSSVASPDLRSRPRSSRSAIPTTAVRLRVVSCFLDMPLVRSGSSSLRYAPVRFPVAATLSVWDRKFGKRTENLRSMGLLAPGWASSAADANPELALASVDLSSFWYSRSGSVFLLGHFVGAVAFCSDSLGNWYTSNSESESLFTRCGFLPKILAGTVKHGTIQEFLVGKCLAGVTMASTYPTELYFDLWISMVRVQTMAQMPEFRRDKYFKPIVTFD